MTEKNVSQSFEIFDHKESFTKVADTRYNSANKQREVLLRYLLERLNLETSHLNDKLKVRK
ncbi:hypothetical protein [Pedobacter nototheniae]|uniref:hypothetical protein n=1 Tax=Pedobacter nototheniae TaxID=2488994 RepID=UPI0010401B44|nr:hypothetical protein [Pedobacter nototheniae]